MPQDPNHIWLRQTVTFTVNGETRTLEMALPLRPGATPGEVEALLDEADAGMRRLSRRLDAHLAALREPERAGVAEAPEAPAASLPPPIPAAVATPATSPATDAAPDLTIPTFLAAITAMGYTQRQAMDKLNVRSLNGLNLRESLESLRRQALLGDQNGATPAPASPPLAFEEEDGEEALAGEPEMELSYPDPASLPDEEEEESEAAPPAPAPTLDALRRDARLTPAAKLPAPQRRASPPPAPAAEEITPPEAEPEETPAARAARTLAELRALHGGGTASAHQRAALANIVTAELTVKGVEALVKDVWTITPDELGPEQLDALISWGKRDHFKDEARDVIRAARAAGPPAPAAPESPTASPDQAEETPPPASGRGGRGGGRARSSGATEGPRGES
jgi:hypothetical protein